VERRAAALPDYPPLGLAVQVPLQEETEDARSDAGAGEGRLDLAVIAVRRELGIGLPGLVQELESAGLGLGGGRRQGEEEQDREEEAAERHDLV
jgi:hypothetical protein